MTQGTTSKKITLREVQRILAVGQLIRSVLTPDELKEIRDAMLQDSVDHKDMYRNQSLTR